MTSPRYALQSAVFAVLDAALPADIRVTDMPDKDTPCPFVDIGKSVIIEGEDKTVEDYGVTMTLVVVTDSDSGVGSKKNSDVQGQVVEALKDGVFTLTGYSLNWMVIGTIGAVNPSDDMNYFLSEIDVEFYIQKI